MNNYLKKSIINCVLSVLLLHITIPHTSGMDISDTEHLFIHKNRSTLYDIFKFFFHENAIGDLDNLPYNIIIAKSTNYIFRSNFQGQKNLNEIFFISNLVKKNTDEVTIFSENNFILIIGLRAPPV